MSRKTRKTNNPPKSNLPGGMKNLKIVSKKPSRTPTLVENFEKIRANYESIQENRTNNIVTGVNPNGSGADWHVKNDWEYLKIVESARYADRNNVVIGQAVSRVINNVLQGGINLNSDTGDPDLDRYLTVRWEEYINDPDQCDLSQEDNLLSLARTALRGLLVDGDIFILPTTEGVQLVEGHRCRTPKNKKENVTLGVELDGYRRHIAYWLTKEKSNNSAITGYNDITRYRTRDENGNKQIIQLCDRRRISQTRGISALTPTLQVAHKHDDLQFAQLIKAQVAAAYAVIRERDVAMEAPPLDPGEVTPGDPGSPEYVLMQQMMSSGIDIGPGMEWIGAPGERISGFSPNIPNTEFFEHAKMLLTFLSINLDLPLAVLLLDPSETNFSGWRGAIDQARAGWSKLQKIMIEKFYRPIYIQKVREWNITDRLLKNENIYTLTKHTWNPPYWAYIDPSKDAQGDKIILDNNLNSRRNLLSRRGLDIDDVDRQIILDKKRYIIQAVEAAHEINTIHPEARVNWREIANIQATDPAYIDDNTANNEGDNQDV